MTALFLGPQEKAQLKALAEHATQHPFVMSEVVEQVKTPEGQEAHLKRLNGFTMDIPMNFRVTFTIEEQPQPVGLCRHLSMSVNQIGRTPNSIAVWMVAQELGFWGESIQDCDQLWPEKLLEGRVAINILQRMQAPAFP